MSREPASAQQLFLNALTIRPHDSALLPINVARNSHVNLLNFEVGSLIFRGFQGVIQKIIDWTVALNFGEAENPPLFQFDIERKASFEQIMQAVDRKIPVSRSELYSSYGLPEPKDDDDAFIKEDSAMLLSDGVRNSGVKKNFSFI